MYKTTMELIVQKGKIAVAWEKRSRKTKLFLRQHLCSPVFYNTKIKLLKKRRKMCKIIVNLIFFSVPLLIIGYLSLLFVCLSYVSLNIFQDLCKQAKKCGFCQTFQDICFVRKSKSWHKKRKILFARKCFPIFF